MLNVKMIMIIIYQVSEHLTKNKKNTKLTMNEVR
jgi:hypothetical protein